MKFPIYQIAKITIPETPKPWLILETNLTIDGPRTRIINGRFSTQEAAIIAVQEKEGKVNIIEMLRPKLENAFNELDDIVVSLAPDAPQKIMDAWCILYDLMSEEFLIRRNKYRGIVK